MSDLDNILSGNGEAVTEQGAITEDQVTQGAEGESQQQQEEAAEQEGQQQGQRMVPHEALHAEKQKVKRYTEEVAEFRRSNESLQRQVGELLQRVPVQKQEPQQAPDQFEDFPGATRHVVQPEFQRIEQQLLAIAKDTAINRFTEEKVNEAEKAFISALQNQKLDPADFQKVANSPNRYAEAVRWHQRQLAQAEIGDDPAAYKAKLEAELREKILAEAQQGGDQSQTQQRPPVMPTNLAGARSVGSRSGPAWSGPASIDDIFNRQRTG